MNPEKQEQFTWKILNTPPLSSNLDLKFPIIHLSNDVASNDDYFLEYYLNYLDDLEQELLTMWLTQQEKSHFFDDWDT